MPLIMCGHQNWDISQNLLSSLFYKNPANTYQIMVLKYSVQAPTSFDQKFHAMSPNEMSTHDIENQS